MGEVEQRIGTRVVRTARVLPAGAGTPVVPPLVQSVAFDYGSLAEQDRVFANERPGFIYGRYGTPTTAALEVALAELDGGEAAQCFVSGMAAIHGVITQLAASGPRDFLVLEDCYGGTHALLERMSRETGLSLRFIDQTDLTAVAQALAGARRPVLYAESMTNPFLRIGDIPALAKLAHEHGGTLVVDATFATPVLQRPLAHGADVVIHSLTKYINGHGDVMGGSATGSRAFVDGLRDRVILDGSYLPPHDAWLTIRGLRTLELRMRRQCESALAIATHLRAHPKVKSVRYPGLADHPQHELARRMLGARFGAMIGLTLARDERAAAEAFLDALDLAASATTMGDLFTEVLYPPVSSHRRLDPAERKRLGMTDGFVRISIGIEDPADLIAELDSALARV